MSEFNIENLNDEPTWDLICEGKTKGVFQLESNLGRHWAKQIKPRNIKELSDLISLIRPGTLQAISKGKSMTQHYADRKSGVDEVEYPHQSLEPLLKDTYSVVLYQEQTMKIAQELAGFSLVEADVLRKAIGKKKADLMAEMKELFINGAEKVGIISKEIASEIFSWIEKSSRYSFNKCLDPETVVYTKDGLKMLHELNIGDMVLAPLNDSEDEYVEILDIIETGEKDIYEIETEEGESIRCTLDHKFLCADHKMRPLYEIIANDIEIFVYSN